MSKFFIRLKQDVINQEDLSIYREIWLELLEKNILKNIQIFEQKEMLKLTHKKLDWKSLLLFEIPLEITVNYLVHQENDLLSQKKTQRFNFLFSTEMQPTVNSSHPDASLRKLDPNSGKRRFLIEYINAHDLDAYEKSMIDICGPAIKHFVATGYVKQILALEIPRMNLPTRSQYTWNQLHIGNYPHDLTLEDIITRFDQSLLSITENQSDYKAVFANLDKIRTVERIDWSDLIFSLDDYCTL